MAKCYDNYSREELIKLLQKQDEELSIKKYGLTWDSEKEPEKVVLDCENNLPILQRVADKEIKTDDSDYNLLIEGDNYHALTVLNYTHKEKIDVIYIDPPYNTGNKDFIYNDSYVDKEDGYRHSKWLNFMEKRLNLAKNLLNENGVIFISIDDNEQANLKLICDKIFGENNKIGILPTIMNLKGNQDEFGFAGTHEYTFVYAKDKNNATINEFQIEDDALKGWQEDEIGFYKKGATLKRTGNDAPRARRPYGYFPILVKKDTFQVCSILKEEYEKIYDCQNNAFDDIFVEQLKLKYENEFFFILPEIDRTKVSWRWQYRKVKNESNEIIVTNGRDGITLYKKQRPEIGDLPTKKPKSLLYKAVYSSGNGTNRLKLLFGEKKFNNPKPVELIKDLIFLGGDKNITILDFTAGSGTTADAIIQLNKEDSGKRKFILCTNNENQICTEVCYPRIEKVINGYNKNGNGEFIDGLGGNLQYYKTDLIPVEKIDKIKDSKRQELTSKAGEMIAIKENCFNQVELNNYYQIFENNTKNKQAVIYFREDLSKFDELINKIGNIKTTLYIFSYGRIDKKIYNYLNDNIAIEDIPEPIIEIYKEINLTLKD